MTGAKPKKPARQANCIPYYIKTSAAAEITLCQLHLYGTKLLSENQNNEIITIEPDVCEIAGLLHDIGHPPFGHVGEAALDKCMASFGGFEGNAQTLRIITRLEKKEMPDEILDSKQRDNRVGLNLTARVIAATLKYDKDIRMVRRINNSYKLTKGYYHTETEIVNQVKKCLVEKPAELNEPFKTVECSIMDIADDIAYSTYDVEDALKADFLTPYDFVAADNYIYEQICEKLKKDNIKNPDGSPCTPANCRKVLIDVFAAMWDKPFKKQLSLNPDDSKYEEKTVENFILSYRSSKKIAKDGYHRTNLTSAMVNAFINGVRIDLDEDNPILSKVYLDDATLRTVNVLKHFSYVVLINSARFRVFESRGKEIVQRMFDKLNSEGGESLLPEDTRLLYDLSTDDSWRARVISDFISGMTDRYALEFYGRLFSENPQTIFKPLY